jgi:hypothetical protein
LAAAYGIVALLLLSLNLTSRWRWWVKAAAIIVTAVFFKVSYGSVNGLMGWPTTQTLPARFTLVSSVISEPDRKTNNAGHIYLWAAELDENNVPSSTPRSYQVSYSDAFARKIAKAQEKHDRGEDVMGIVSGHQTVETGPRGNIKLGRMQDNSGQQSPATDTVPIKEDGSDITFEDLPPVLLPDKGPLPDPHS